VYSMASSWITTPQLRPSSDTASSASHPGLLVPNANLHMASSRPMTPDAKLAHERAGPLAVSAARICVGIGEDGRSSLPSGVVLDKQPIHSAPAIVTLQVKDGPLALTNVHRNAFTTSPLPKHRHVARSQSPSSTATFERQVLASVPTVNSQAVAPLSAASDLTPTLPRPA